jgi:hypothetical protein
MKPFRIGISSSGIVSSWPCGILPSHDGSLNTLNINMTVGDHFRLSKIEIDRHGFLFSSCE